MSIDACRSAQQSVHAQAQIDKHQFSIDVSGHIAVRLLHGLSQRDDIVVVNELAEFGQKRALSFGQPHQFLGAIVSHDALSNQVQRVVKEPFLAFSTGPANDSDPSTMAFPSLAQHDRIHAEKRSKSG